MLKIISKSWTYTVQIQSYNNNETKMTHTSREEAWKSPGDQVTLTKTTLQAKKQNTTFVRNQPGSDGGDARSYNSQISKTYQACQG
jgi:hypothetical protein